MEGGGAGLAAALPGWHQENTEHRLYQQHYMQENYLHGRER